jgi:ABC-2 type transport system ATP-binding protein
LIEIRNITKKYGKHIGVNNISFHVEKGEILGFLGPNGAGKTTTMNLITGYIPLTYGEIKVSGFDVMEDSMEAKKHIGYLPENPPLYLDMTVKEYLYFVGEIKQVPKIERKNQVLYVLEVLKLQEVSGRLIKNLSKGFKQRVGLAQALIGDPEVLILDEPTVGLDPQQIIEIRELIKELGKKHTIILSSHILPEVSAVCSRIVVIQKGKILAMDTTENFMGMNEKNRFIKIEVEGKHEKAIRILERIPGFQEFHRLEGDEKEQSTVTYLLKFDGQKDRRKDLFLAFAKEEMPLLELSIQKRTLEETYLQLLAMSDQDTSLKEQDTLIDAGVEDLHKRKEESSNKEQASNKEQSGEQEQPSAEEESVDENEENLHNNKAEEDVK